MSVGGATSTNSVAAGDVGFQELAKLFWTTEIGALLTDSFGAVCRPAAFGGKIRKADIPQWDREPASTSSGSLCLSITRGAAHFGPSAPIAPLGIRTDARLECARISYLCRGREWPALAGGRRHWQLKKIGS